MIAPYGVKTELSSGRELLAASCSIILFLFKQSSFYCDQQQPDKGNHIAKAEKSLQPDPLPFPPKCLWGTLLFHGFFDSTYHPGVRKIDCNLKFKLFRILNFLACIVVK
ncbi:hypothetical protein GQ457_12G011680 [Hibiscus cannabinus]